MGEGGLLPKTLGGETHSWDRMVGGWGVSRRLAKSGVNLAQGETPAISQSSNGGWSPHTTRSLASELASSEDPALKLEQKVSSPLGLSGGDTSSRGEKVAAGSMHLEAPCSLPPVRAPAGLWQRQRRGGDPVLASCSQLARPRRPGLNLASPHCKVRAKLSGKRKAFFGNTQASSQQDPFLRPARAASK